jgi:hypothetical protein
VCAGAAISQVRYGPATMAAGGTHGTLHAMQRSAPHAIRHRHGPATCMSQCASNVLVLTAQVVVAPQHDPVRAPPCGRGAAVLGRHSPACSQWCHMRPACACRPGHGQQPHHRPASALLRRRAVVALGNRRAAMPRTPRGGAAPSGRQARHAGWQQVCSRCGWCTHAAGRGHESPVAWPACVLIHVLPRPRAKETGKQPAAPVKGVAVPSACPVDMTSRHISMGAVHAQLRASAAAAA